MTKSVALVGILVTAALEVGCLATVEDPIADDGPSDIDADDNAAPIARLDRRAVARVGAVVVLDGTGSVDPDGDALGYQWTLVGRPAGSAAELGAPDRPEVELEPDLAGDYVAELVVTDGLADSAPAFVTVAVAPVNAPPVADAGGDRAARVGERIVLDGGASADPDGDAMAFAWRLVSRPEPSAAVLDGADGATPSLVLDQPGDYLVTLTVEDGHADSVPDYALVRARINTPPIALAGVIGDATVEAGAAVALIGEAHDDDGDELRYLWQLFERPPGSAAALSDAGGPDPQLTTDVPGVYAVGLVVNDGMDDSERAEVFVEAIAP